MRVVRVDAPSHSKVVQLPNGGLRIEASLSRTGIQKYTDATGSERLEYRPEEEVFSDASMASFKGVPVTIGHPKNFVSPDNYKDLAVGHVSDDVRRGDGTLDASIVIMAREAVDAIECDAVHDVSVGYSVELDETPGITPDGQRFDAIQRHIVANHLAILGRGQGRGGPKVSLHLDSALSSVLPYNTTMSKVSLPEVVTEVVVPATNVNQARLDQLEGELRAQAATIAQLKAALVQAKDPKRVDAMVQERAALLSVALPILGSEYRVDGKTLEDVRKDVVAKALPEEHLDGVSADYIKGLFKGVVSAAEKAPAPGLSSVRVDAVNAARIDGPNDQNELKDAYNRRLKADAERCKPPGAPTRLSAKGNQ